MLQARRLGKELIVGIHSDEDILDNKGPTVMTLEERLVGPFEPSRPMLTPLFVKESLLLRPAVGRHNLFRMLPMSLLSHGYRTMAAIMWSTVTTSPQTATERIAIDMSRRLGDSSLLREPLVYPRQILSEGCSFSRGGIS
jgi:hypothetical protein